MGLREGDGGAEWRLGAADISAGTPGKSLLGSVHPVRGGIEAGAGGQHLRRLGEASLVELVRGAA